MRWFLAVTVLAFFTMVTACAGSATRDSVSVNGNAGAKIAVYPEFWTSEQGYESVAFVFSPKDEQKDTTKYMVTGLANKMNLGGWYVAHDEYLDESLPLVESLKKVVADQVAEVVIILRFLGMEDIDYSWNAACSNNKTFPSLHTLFFAQKNQNSTCVNTEMRSMASAHVEIVDVSTGERLMDKDFSYMNRTKKLLNSYENDETVIKELINQIYEELIPHDLKFAINQNQAMTISARHGTQLVNDEFVTGDKLKIVLNLPEEAKFLPTVFEVVPVGAETKEPSIYEEFGWDPDSSGFMNFELLVDDLLEANSGINSYQMNLYLSGIKVSSKSFRILTE